MTHDNAHDLARAFEAQEIEPADFRHADHIRVAFEMLKSYDFVDASARYAANIRALALRAGAPGKFNATITFAFMSIIAERMSMGDHHGGDSFLAGNPDLMEKGLLDAWYSADRLNSDAARQMFLLPDVSNGTGVPA